MYKLRVFSPNKSCAPLRNIIFNKRILLRLGSTTPLISKYKYLEINSIDGIRTSANKITMKQAFDKSGITHSEWITSTISDKIINFFIQHKVIIAKHKHSSQGKNIYYIDNILDLKKLLGTINIKDFVFEKYYFFPDEFRLHIDVTYGCFYACKKILNPDAEVEWHKHGNNSIFVLVKEDIKLPDCWVNIIEQCTQALKQMNLQIACFDILCSNNKFIIVESNTAPSLATFGVTFYSNHLKKRYGTRL